MQLNNNIIFEPLNRLYMKLDQVFFKELKKAV